MTPTCEVRSRRSVDIHPLFVSHGRVFTFFGNKSPSLSEGVGHVPWQCCQMVAGVRLVVSQQPKMTARYFSVFCTSTILQRQKCFRNIAPLKSYS